MKKIRRWFAGILVFALTVVILLGLRFYRQRNQVADPNYDTRVANPAFPTRHPRVLFDEAHHNFHTPGGLYKPFAQLITQDGYQVAPNSGKFQRATLEGYDVLVIANALGAWLPILPGASKPAFTDEECDAVRDWVRQGGALLLISDHEPAGAAAKNLAQRFGVEMSTGRTFDQAAENHDPESPSWLLFTRDNHLLGDDAITNGRSTTEHVQRVVAFTGQSLKVPEESIVFMKLGDSAFDVLPSGGSASAGSRAQGVALRFGRGRVVVVGEAAMFSAQLGGPQRVPFGMNRPGNDNRQLVLNVMHWLSGLLD